MEILRTLFRWKQLVLVWAILTPLGCGEESGQSIEVYSPSKNFSYSVNRTKTGQVINFTQVDTNRVFSQLFLNECTVAWGPRERLWIFEKRSQLDGGDRVCVFFSRGKQIVFRVGVPDGFELDIPQKIVDEVRQRKQEPEDTSSLEP